MNLREILFKKYDIGIDNQKKFTSMGYRNYPFLLTSSEGVKYTFIIYKDDKNLELFNDFSIFLSKNNFPARHVIKTIDGKDILKLKKENLKLSASLYKYIEGDTIPWEGWTKKHLFLLGRAMVEIHKLGLGYIKNTNYTVPVVEEVLDSQIKNMKSYFLDSKVRRSINRKLSITLNTEKIIRMFENIQNISAKDATILHMDLVRGNVLFRKTKKQNSTFVIKNLELAGVIDFEKLSLGNPVYDVARTLAFLLVDCKFKKDLEIIKYFFKLGYLKAISVSTSQDFIYNLKILLNYFWLYDFYKFLKHNPYESLKENSHYQRTVKRLEHLETLNHNS